MTQSSTSFSFRSQTALTVSKAGIKSENKINLKSTTKTVKAEKDEMEMKRAAEISLYLNGNSNVLANKLFCTLTSHRIIFSKGGSTEYLFLSSIEQVETSGTKSSFSRIIGQKQEYCLVLKTQSGAWTLVFSNAFPGSIQKPDHERDEWAEAIKTAIGQTDIDA